MIQSARQDVADLLRDVRGGGSFSTRRTALTDSLSIEVRDVGVLSFPVTAAQAKALRLVARPARYGNGEETLLDRQVRDTWEVPRSRVTIDNRRWASTLRPMLDQVRDDLGLPATCSLTAELHSMLVYEPDQFFAAHQDSEKQDRMIGSLVVLLPSRSTGGDLAVSHQGTTVTHRGSATALTFVAFYSDTRHEVLPVESGYRVALTYNLRLDGDTVTSGPAGSQTAAAVAALVEQHFATPTESRWRGDNEAGEPPDRLVFLLDHQYSEHSLRWPQLKGEDATRARTLRDAAALADCDVALAHAEVHETWDIDYDDAPRRGRRGWSSWDDGPDPDDTDALSDLIDSNVEIRPAEGGSVGGRQVADDELATATPSIELEPYDTEYTGNMGNYGNTMDRWYRRAAVVVWPRARAFALRAKGDPAGALDELLASASDDPPVDAHRVEMVSVLLRFWPHSVREHDQPEFLGKALRLAVSVGDAGLASRLLEPFRLEALRPTDAAALLAAVNKFGPSWFAERLSTWMAQRHSYAGNAELPARTAWAADLDTICEHLLTDASPARTDLKIDAAQLLVHTVWDWLEQAIDSADSLPQPSVRRHELAALGAPMIAIVRATTRLDDTALSAEIVTTIRRDDRDLTALMLSMIDIAAQDTASLPATDFAPFAQRCADLLQSELARPERQPDDWSINSFQRSDHCQDCTQLAEFLADPHQRQLVWPLAKPRREHIHHRIDEAEFPITHQTRREGSPHKLVLIKTADLHHGDTERRTAAHLDLDTVNEYLHQVGHAR